MIMGRELFRSGGFWAWKFWLDLIVHTPMWVKHPPLSVGQGSLSLHLCYRVLVNLPFCSTNQGSISTPTLLKSTFSSLGPQTFLKASLALAPLGNFQPAGKPLGEWQLHFQEERMGCLKQQVSFNELKSCHNLMLSPRWDSRVAVSQAAAHSMYLLLCSFPLFFCSNPLGTCSMELADSVTCQGWGAFRCWERWTEGYLTSRRTSFWKRPMLTTHESQIQLVLNCLL